MRHSSVSIITALDKILTLHDLQPFVIKLKGNLGGRSRPRSIRLDYPRGILEYSFETRSTNGIKSVQKFVRFIEAKSLPNPDY